MRRARGVPILTYHSIDDEGGPTSVRPDIFRRQMTALRNRKVECIPLKDLQKVRDNPGKSYVAITFDDGYENIFTNAFPVLRENGLTATVFLVSDFLGGFNEWEPVSEVPRLRHLSAEQVVEMSRCGIEFGSHTCSHPNLTRISGDDARKEIGGSKRHIENLVQQDVASFCYPYGSVNEGIRNLVETTGFSFACTLKFGMGRPERDPLMLSRFGMNRMANDDPAVSELYLLNCLYGSVSYYINLRDALR